MKQAFAFTRFARAAVAAVMVLTAASAGTSAQEAPLAGTGEEDDPYLISTDAGLAFLAAEINAGNAAYAGKHYRLTADISLSENYGAEAEFNDEQGWIPIGTAARPFSGTFDGNGKVISGLFIDVAIGSTGNFYAGLFGSIGAGGSVKDLGVVDVLVNVSGRNFFAGGVAGYVTGGGRITGCYTTGAVKGSNTVSGVYPSVGGVVGYVGVNGGVAGCYSSATVSGAGFVDIGGITGGAGSGGGVTTTLTGSFVNNSYSTGTVTVENIGAGAGKGSAGGIAGAIHGGIVANCYFAGTVKGVEYAGGIAGFIDYGSVASSYSIGAVSNAGGSGSLTGGIAGGVFSQTGCGVTGCAALNPSVVTASGAAGRVLGGVLSGALGSVLSNNVAFGGMSGSFTTAAGAATLNGAGITAANINIDGTVGGLFGSEGGWTSEAGSLPGLFGNTVPMPEHLTPPPFVAVTSITGVPEVMAAGTPLALTGTVVPANASGTAIVWSVAAAGTTAPGASITGSALSASGPGTVAVTATVVSGTAVGVDYTQNFSITVTEPPPSRGITIALRDYYGDGWNGAALRVSVNGVNRSPNATLSASASSGTSTFTAGVGDSVAVYWVRGSYDEECAFAVYYTDAPPSPAFNPASSASNDLSALLVYRRYGSLSSTANGALLGSFRVALVSAETPAISAQPLGGAVIAGAARTLSVTASVKDTGTLSYQWYDNTAASVTGGTAIAGATAAAYSPNTANLGTFYYYVIVTNTKANAPGNKTASVTSNVVTLAVIDPDDPRNLTPVGRYGQLRVAGNRILGQYGDTVQLRGMSFFWSMASEGRGFYNAGAVDWLADDWKVNVVRAAMGVDETWINTTVTPRDTASGYLAFDNSGGVSNKKRVTDVVDAAIAKGIYAIIDWHSHRAHMNTDKAVEFFQEMAAKYKDVPNVIYEIYNEPEDISWSTVRTYSQTVVNAIRAIDPNNLIIIGTPTWSQDVDIAALNPVSGDNLVYALHFYAASTYHRQYLRDKASSALNAGRAVFVSEFGICNHDGGAPIDTVESNVWLNFLNQNKISWVNWSVSDKAEAASALKPGARTDGQWAASDLTVSGTYIRNKLIKAYEAEMTAPPPPPPPPAICTLTYTAGAGGSIFGVTPQTVTAGGSGTAVLAVPATGYEFVSWSDNLTVNPRTDMNVQGNITVGAAFRETAVVPPVATPKITAGQYIVSAGVITSARITFDTSVSFGWFHSADFYFGASKGTVTDLSCVSIDPASAAAAVISLACAFPGTSIPEALGGDSRIAINFTASYGGGTQTINMTDGTIGVLTPDRAIPDIKQYEETAVMPVSPAGLKLTAGPNPAAKSAGSIRFFVDAGTAIGRPRYAGDNVLTVYDAQGNVVKKIPLSDNAPMSPSSPQSPADARRVVGEWDLRDAKGRPVSEGAYLIRGTIKTAGGKREKVSIIVGVR